MYNFTAMAIELNEPEVSFEQQSRIFYLEVISDRIFHQVTKMDSNWFERKGFGNKR